MIVLDASALLAYLFRETGQDIVGEVIVESCTSTVNLSEVISRFSRDGHDSRDVLIQIQQSPLEAVPFLAEDAALTAALLPATRPLGLSLGDRACLALAMARNIPVYTADQVWARLDLGISIRIIR